MAIVGMIQIYFVEGCYMYEYINLGSECGGASMHGVRSEQKVFIFCVICMLNGILHVLLKGPDQQ